MNEIEKPQRLILIDGSSYLYRAFHALPPLTNSAGEPTGAVYGVVNMIKRLLTDFPAEYVAVVFDAKGKTFRHDLYTDYKAHRPPMPDELRQQIAPLHATIKAMGLPLLIIEGVEADDVIGTLTEKATQKNCAVLISTGDKDMAQLITPNVTLINTMTNSQLTEKNVTEKFGIPADKIIDYLALIGDQSDNIPGVPKVGPKTAVKWLDEYGSLDNLIENATAIKGKIGDNLRDHLDKLPLTRQLLTIKCDVDLPVQITDLTPQPANTDELAKWYTRLEFKRWLADLNENFTPQVAEKATYQLIDTETALDELLKQLAKCTAFTFDTETTSLNTLDASLVGLAIAYKPHHAYYIPCGHKDQKQIDINLLIKLIKPLFENPAIEKIGHNLKYDLAILENVGINVQGKLYDTMLESYVLNSVANRHSLDTLALKHLNYAMTSYESVTGKGSKQVLFNEVDTNVACQYAAEDADMTLQLHQTLYPQVNEQATLRKVFESIEMPLVPVLQKIEHNGVLIDADLLKQQSSALSERINTLQAKAYELVGHFFNLSSPAQLQTLLFDNLKLPVLAKTPKGQPSTAESVLQELARRYELPKIILEYRQLSKLQSTYTDPLPKQIHPKTGRVHTSYHQAGTSTGRLSSTNPNLQNIPIRTEEGRRIRQAFIAPEGSKIVAADYSQVELRIMAHLSDDEGLKEAFAAKLDIHKATASEIFNTPLDQVTAIQRRNAKAVNFGLIYGMSAFGLAKQLDISREEAQHYINRYFERYPKVQDYMEQTREKARKQGFVETLSGRRLYLLEINASNQQRRKAAERVAINAPMQGTAADLIKLAMIDIAHWLQTENLKTKMIMQVHDELVFEVPENELTKIKEIVPQRMANALKLNVPLLVDVGIGNNWDEAH